MKKLIMLLAAACLATGAHAAYKDGTYEGSGEGLHGKIDVSVTVADGKISEVKVVKNEETDMIIAAAIDEVIPAIVKNNSVEGVQAVAGATFSSNGIMAAVKDALAKAQ